MADIASSSADTPGTLELGAFSVSLSVADLGVSQAFYERLGFERTGGDDSYAIMVNGTTIIGLFHGMFEGNILTWNPGLTNTMAQLDDFTDVRQIQAHLLARGIEVTETVEEGTSGAGHLRLVDPDGNAILIDQFF